MRDIRGNWIRPTANPLAAPHPASQLFTVPADFGAYNKPDQDPPDMFPVEEPDDGPPDFLNGGSTVVPDDRTPSAVEGSVSNAKAAFLWQKERQRPDGPPSTAMPGFGVDGGFTLWLPSAEIKVERAVVDRKIVTRVIPSAMTTPRMAELRDRALAGISGSFPDIYADAGLGDYAIALIDLCYVVDDQELSMLLAGQNWHDGIIRHLLGGDDSVDRQRRLSVEAILSLTPALIPDSTPVAMAPATAGKPARKWRFPWTK